MGLKTAAIFVALILATVPLKAEELIKLSLDDILNISPKIEADKVVKVEGKSSLKITTAWPTTVCLGEVIKPDTENTRLIFGGLDFGRKMLKGFYQF